MDFLLGAVSGVIERMADAIGNWSFTRNISQDVATLRTYYEKANAFLPVDTALTILGLMIGLYLVLIAFYWIVRAINLIRGAG